MYLKISICDEIFKWIGSKWMLETLQGKRNLCHCILHFNICSDLTRCEHDKKNINTISFLHIVYGQQTEQSVNLPHPPPFLSLNCLFSFFVTDAFLNLMQPNFYKLFLDSSLNVDGDKVDGNFIASRIYLKIYAQFNFVQN